jgi:UPF0716 protein FxsA
MAVLLVMLFVAVPIAELIVIVLVGNAIGVWPTIALLIVDSLLGSVLMRSQGRTAWRRFNAALTAGRPPAREVLDGALVIFGGALLLTPGFLSDILGLLLLLPPSRALVRRVLVARLAHRMALSAAASYSAGARRRPRRNGDVEGTATEVDPGRLPPRGPGGDAA